VEKSYSDLNGFGSVDHVFDPVILFGNVYKNKIKQAMEEKYLLSARRLKPLNGCF
tara:strand:- start:156 stop:320 length:165 start_codon:yes stop_codon:yes gene_type:complete